MQQHNSTIQTLSETSSPTIISKYALSSPLCKLRSKERRRSTTSCSATGSLISRKGREANITGKKVNPKETRVSRKRPSCTDEDEDFKFLDKVIDNMNAQTRVSRKMPSCTDEDEDFKFLDKVIDNMNAQTRVSRKRPSCTDEDEDFKFLDKVIDNMNAGFKKQLSVEILESQDYDKQDTEPSDIIGQLSDLILNHIQRVKEITQEFHFINNKKQRNDEKCSTQMNDKKIEEVFQAYNLYRSTMQEIDLEIAIEETRMFSKAVELNLGNQCLFTKCPAKCDCTNKH